MYRKVIKRIIDIVLSGIGIVVAAIPMLVVALLIKIDSPGPVFFKRTEGYTDPRAEKCRIIFISVPGSNTQVFDR